MMDIELINAVESFRKAVIDADAYVLAKLLDENLSYGHSDAHVEGKNDLITKLSDGTYKFVTMDFSEQSVGISNNIAIVRHNLDGNTLDGGKPNEAHLHVLTVWYNPGSSWKMIARQAV